MPDNDPETMTPDLSEHYRQLSALGARKGAQARKNVLTPEQRSDIAMKAARSRWGKPEENDDSAEQDVQTAAKVIPAKEPALPFSMFRGNLKFGDLEVECHVLSDGRRVFTQREVVRVLTAGVNSGKLIAYLRPNPLIPDD